MARRLGTQDIHGFTPQCHWGSCLVGRRCPGEGEREVGLDNTWALASAWRGGGGPPKGFTAASAPAGSPGPPVQSCHHG